MLLLPPPNEGGYVFTSVCLSVCLFARLLKKLRAYFGEIFGRLGRGPRNNLLGFGGDLDWITVRTGNFYTILYLLLRFLHVDSQE